VKVYIPKQSLREFQITSPSFHILEFNQNCHLTKRFYKKKKRYGVYHSKIHQRGRFYSLSINIESLRRFEEVTTNKISKNCGNYSICTRHKHQCSEGEGGLTIVRIQQ